MKSVRSATQLWKQGTSRIHNAIKTAQQLYIQLQQRTLSRQHCTVCVKYVQSSSSNYRALSLTRQRERVTRRRLQKKKQEVTAHRHIRLPVGCVLCSICESAARRVESRRVHYLNQWIEWREICAIDSNRVAAASGEVRQLSGGVEHQSVGSRHQFSAIDWSPLSERQ